LNHIGHYEFQGDLSKMPKFGNEVAGVPDAAPAALKDAINMAKKKED
jgi:hypothetical protein